MNQKENNPTAMAIVLTASVTGGIIGAFVGVTVSLINHFCSL